MALNRHEVTISSLDLIRIQGGGRATAITNEGQSVLLTRSDDVPADRLNADGRGAVWLPVNQHMLNDLTVHGHTGFVPNYVDMVFGVYVGR